MAQELGGEYVKNRVIDLECGCNHDNGLRITLDCYVDDSWLLWLNITVVVSLRTFTLPS